MNKSIATLGLALLATCCMALEGCGSSSTTTPPPPTLPPPTTVPVTVPTPDPLIAACGSPSPPPLYGIKVKVQTDQGYRKLVDSRPIVKNVNGYCDKVGHGGPYCDTRLEGDLQREACDALVMGRAKDTGRYGPTWYFEARPCVEAGVPGDSCVNHPDNQFLVVTRGEGEILACAADNVPVDEARCGGCQLIVGSSACQ